jgi:RNA polymerase sigma-70 factor (ECF subfamily)
VRPELIQLDDARQMVREKLFVAVPGERPLIARYGGRGDLRAWFRVVATRLMLNAVTRGPKERTGTDEDIALVEQVDDQESPDLAHMRELYDAEMREIFPKAVATLSIRERVLLRQRYLDGLSVEKLSRLHGVHVATTRRQLAAARESLQGTIARMLGARLRARPEELESVLRLLRTRFRITASRLFTS